VELGIELLPPARAGACKIAPGHFSRSRTNVRQAICERHSTPRLKDPVQLPHASIVLTDPLFDINEARSPSLTTKPRAKGGVLLHHASQIAST